MMPLADTLWFEANPHRAFRLRRQTPAETGASRIRDGLSPWCVIRRADGVTEPLGFGHGDGWPDDDAALVLFFSATAQEAA